MGGAQRVERVSRSQATVKSGGEVKLAKKTTDVMSIALQCKRHAKRGEKRKVWWSTYLAADLGGRKKRE